MADGFNEVPKAASTTRWVYSFGGGAADGDAKMKNLLGGKGANLAEMSSLGLPVPPGLTITTEACVHYYAEGKSYPAGLQEQVDQAALSKVEAQAGKRFGEAANPLLVSVRSGARASMPGMMDTVLNLGLNDETVEGLSQASPATGGSPSTAIAGSSRCTPTWCWGWSTACSRRSWTTTRSGWRCRWTPP